MTRVVLSNLTNLSKRLVSFYHKTRVMSQTGTWGHLAPLEAYGKAGDKKEDYILLDYAVAKSLDYKDKMHGSHAMIYAKDNTVLWNLYPMKAAILMQMRFDGLMGFPGGLVDPGEDPLTALNRELHEEIGLDLQKFSFREDEQVLSCYHEKKNLVLHFYAKEVKLDDFKTIERQNLTAVEYGIETLGVIRPPLYTMGDGFRGLPAFLTNNFAGNAREEFMYALVKLNILSEDEVKQALDSCNQFRTAQSIGQQNEH